MIFIPTWVNGVILITSFMIVYEIYRKDFGGHSIFNPRFGLMAGSLGWLCVAAFGNDFFPSLSVVFFVGALACLAGAIYFHRSQPRKLPTEPSTD